MPADNGPAQIVLANARAFPSFVGRLAEGQIYGATTAIVRVNDSGDPQKALDMGAHDHMVAALRGAGVRQVLSKEAETVIPLNPIGLWDGAIDPIDGSGSLGIGAPLGLLYSVMPVAAEGFLLTGRTVVAAGYASFGHSCDFGFSLGAGVDIATLDQPQDRFRLTHQNLHLTKEAKTVVFEASIERRWPPGLQAWAGDLRAGKDGPRERDFNMRWLAAELCMNLGDGI